MALATAATFGAAGTAMAATDPPVYPGSTLYVSAATKRPMAMTKCGHTTTLYHTFDVPKSANVKSVVAWYRRMLPGASFMGPSPDVYGGGTYITQDTARGVTILQSMAPSASADMLGDDRISISFMKYDPPLGQPFVDVMVKASRNDKAAAAQLKRMCPNGF